MATRDDIFAMIGLTVLESQVVESLLNIVLTYVLQDGNPLTYERLMQIEKSHRRKTLGFFIRAMRERADYSSDLENVLERFLESRNTLIHRFREIDGHHLDTQKDRDSVHAFLNQLHKDSWRLTKFMAAWIVAWQDQTGIGKGSLDNMMAGKADSLLREINALSKTVNQNVFQKT
jgi:hypothetical protein